MIFQKILKKWHFVILFKKYFHKTVIFYYSVEGMFILHIHHFVFPEKEKENQNVGELKLAIEVSMVIAFLHLGVIIATISCLITWRGLVYSCIIKNFIYQTEYLEVQSSPTIFSYSPCNRHSWRICCIYKFLANTRVIIAT